MLELVVGMMLPVPNARFRDVLVKMVFNFAFCTSDGGWQFMLAVCLKQLLEALMLCSSCADTFWSVMCTALPAECCNRLEAEYP
jgi:hypothetical protein